VQLVFVLLVLGLARKLFFPVVLLLFRVAFCVGRSSTSL
jgi:hypothetical protein